MRDKARLALTWAGGHVPSRFWQATLKVFLRNDRLVERYGSEVFAVLAAKRNISRVSAIGQYGIFSSLPSDEYVLGAYARDRIFEPHINAAIAGFFPDGRGTYFDIGANIGLTIIPVAAGSQIACYAFEPGPENFKNLITNIAENAIENSRITPLNYALFDRDDVLEFELCPSNPGDNRVRFDPSTHGNLYEEMRETINVPAKRLDGLNLPITHPFLAKLDTQGAEPFIIAGGRDTLAQADAIILEWAPYLMRRMNGDAKVVLQFLRTNFSLAKIEGVNGDWHNGFRPIDEICDYLSKNLSAWSDRPSNYLDIAATKG
jgi:FkbM family methyltransferase